MFDTVFTETCAACAHEIGIELKDDQLKKCLAFAKLVVEWNERMNLTSLVGPEEMAIKHFVDSFSCLRSGVWPTGGRAVDVGTGAGFPGVPLAILRPDMEWLLTDSLKKRIEFLKVAVEELGLDRVQCVHSRAEELGQQKSIRETCDVAVARAVARMPVLLEYCVPLVRKGGGFLAMKGPEGEEEANAALKAAKTLGCGEPQIERFQLPREAGARTLVWYEKKRNTMPAFPRRPGVPMKTPL